MYHTKRNDDEAASGNSKGQKQKEWWINIKVTYSCSSDRRPAAAAEFQADQKTRKLTNVMKNFEINIVC